MALKVQFEIGNISKLRSKKTAEGFTHDWELFVRGVNEADISAFVDKVVFNLHDSFPKPKRVIKEPPYLIQESGYAGFQLPIDIYFRNRDEPKRVQFFYDLDLQTTGPPQRRSEVKTFIFATPSEELRQKLLKGGGVPVAAVSGTVVGNVLPPAALNTLSVGSAATFADEGMVSKPKLSNSESNGKKHKSSTRIVDDAKQNTFANLFGTPITKSSSSSSSSKHSPETKAVANSALTSKSLSAATGNNNGASVTVGSKEKTARDKDKDSRDDKNKEKSERSDKHGKQTNAAILSPNKQQDSKKSSSNSLVADVAKHDKRSSSDDKPKKDKTRDKERDRSKEKSSSSKSGSGTKRALSPKTSRETGASSPKRQTPTTTTPPPAPASALTSNQTRPQAATSSARFDDGSKLESSKNKETTSNRTKEQSSSSSSSKKSKKEKKDKDKDKDKEREKDKEKDKRADEHKDKHRSSSDGKKDERSASQSCNLTNAAGKLTPSTTHSKKSEKDNNGSSSLKTKALDKVLNTEQAVESASSASSDKKLSSSTADKEKEKKSHKHRKKEKSKDKDKDKDKEKERDKDKEKDKDKDKESREKTKEKSKEDKEHKSTPKSEEKSTELPPLAAAATTKTAATISNSTAEITKTESSNTEKPKEKEKKSKSKASKDDKDKDKRAVGSDAAKKEKSYGSRGAATKDTAAIEITPIMASSVNVDLQENDSQQSAMPDTLPSASNVLPTVTQQSDNWNSSFADVSATTTNSSRSKASIVVETATNVAKDSGKSSSASQPDKVKQRGDKKNDKTNNSKAEKAVAAEKGDKKRRRDSGNAAAAAAAAAAVTVTNTSNSNSNSSANTNNNNNNNTFIEPPVKQSKKEQVKRASSKSPSLRNGRADVLIAVNNNNNNNNNNVTTSSASCSPAASVNVNANASSIAITNVYSNANNNNNNLLNIPQPTSPALADDAQTNQPMAAAAVNSSTAAHFASSNTLSVEYLSELQELHQKIMTLQDNEELQQVVEMIAQTGCFEITAKTFDFDLCKLDRTTVQRLQEFFATPPVS